MAPSRSWDFNRIPLNSLSRPGDATERDANAMADRALSTTLSTTARAVAGIQRRATSENTGAASTIASRLGRGLPLDDATRDYFEPRFRADLSNVRVHDHNEAHRAAAGLSAKAFTVGQNIAFGNGQYAPGTKIGRVLIAHELAHTIQQRIEPAPNGIFRDPIPGWNFKPSDYARMQEGGKDLTIASDSSFFPAKLQENLLKTLKYVLGPAITPPATEGVNALDFFHGHLVIKKDPATEKESKAAAAKGDKFAADLKSARTKALGGEVKYPKYPLTAKNIGAYKTAVETVLPSFGTLLEGGAKVPGAAMMYHTFEFNQPSDLKAKGEKKKNDDPRRHYVTPLDTNSPRQYSPPSPDTYEKEYTFVISFSFLVDDKGAVHVRPMDASTGFTTLELSTITGTTYPEPLQFEE